jgi:hypothetical protein
MSDAPVTFAVIVLSIAILSWCDPATVVLHSPHLLCKPAAVTMDTLHIK